MKRTPALDAGEVLTDRREVHVVIEPRVLGIEVAARVYSLSADTIARLQDQEGLPLIRVGTRRLVPVAAADAWFAARTSGGAA